MAIGNTKPSFKMKNCGTNATRAKYEAEIKLFVLNLKGIGSNSVFSACPDLWLKLCRGKWRPPAPDDHAPWENMAGGNNIIFYSHIDNFSGRSTNLASRTNNIPPATSENIYLSEFIVPFWQAVSEN